MASIAVCTLMRSVPVISWIENSMLHLIIGEFQVMEQPLIMMAAFVHWQQCLCWLVVIDFWKLLVVRSRQLLLRLR